MTGDLFDATAVALTMGLAVGFLGCGGSTIGATRSDASAERDGELEAGVPPTTDGASDGDIATSYRAPRCARRRKGLQDGVPLMLRSDVGDTMAGVNPVTQGSSSAALEKVVLALLFATAGCGGSVVVGDDAGKPAASNAVDAGVWTRFG